MEGIHLIQPMGGGGTRFGNKGFELPKPLIPLQGKPFFYWAVQSVLKSCAFRDLTCVVLKEHVEKFSIDKEILKYYQDARIVVIPEVTEGAVITGIKGVEWIKDDRPILFNDCDHAFISREFSGFCKNGDFELYDGALLTFDSNNPAYSYVRYNEDGQVAGTIEKKVLSRDAICGAYYFKNKENFMNSAKEYLKACSYSEYFMSGIYNVMINAGKSIGVLHLDEHITFGTPEEYDQVLDDKRLRELE